MKRPHVFFRGSRRLDPLTGCLSLIGCVLFALGSVIVLIALPRWLWPLLLGAALIATGWVLLAKKV